MLRGDKTEQERKERLEEGVYKLNERFDRLEALIKELKADQYIESIQAFVSWPGCNCAVRGHNPIRGTC